MSIEKATVEKFRQSVHKENVLSDVFDSLIEESKELDRRENEIRRTHFGKDLARALNAINAERQSITESREVIKRHREM